MRGRGHVDLPIPFRQVIGHVLGIERLHRTVEFNRETVALTELSLSIASLQAGTVHDPESVVDPPTRDGDVLEGSPGDQTGASSLAHAVDLGRGPLACSQSRKPSSPSQEPDDNKDDGYHPALQTSILEARQPKHK